MIMGYILVQPEVLRAKGIDYFETIPDGRAIAEMRMLKVLGSMSAVDIISSAAELKKLIADQIAAGITPPEVEDTTAGDGTLADAGISTEEPFVPSVEDVTDKPSDNEGSKESVETESVTDNMEDMTDGNE